MFCPAACAVTAPCASACRASMMARSNGPPGTSRVMAKTTMVTPSSVGGISSARRMK